MNNELPPWFPWFMLAVSFLGMLARYNLMRGMGSTPGPRRHRSRKPRH